MIDDEKRREYLEGLDEMAKLDLRPKQREPLRKVTEIVGAFRFLSDVLASQVGEQEPVDLDERLSPVPAKREPWDATTPRGRWRITVEFWPDDADEKKP
jgi:hypothetical protein